MLLGGFTGVADAHAAYRAERARRADDATQPGLLDGPIDAPVVDDQDDEPRPPRRTPPCLSGAALQATRTECRGVERRGQVVRLSRTIFGVAPGPGTFNQGGTDSCRRGAGRIVVDQDRRQAPRNRSLNGPSVTSSSQTFSSHDSPGRWSNTTSQPSLSPRLSR